MPDNPEMLPALMGLQKAIGEQVDIGMEELSLLLPHLKMNKMDKGDLLVKQGQVENNMHFIVDGVTRSFFIKDGKDISFEFYFPGMFIRSYASFLTGTASRHSIEAFTPLTIFSIAHNDLMEAYGKSRKLEQMRIFVTEELFKKTSERNMDFLSLSATERYLKLLNEHPQYVQNIPLKYLASYLNITPESLSRIRKHI